MTKPRMLLTETTSKQRKKKLRYLRQTRKYLIEACFVSIGIFVLQPIWVCMQHTKPHTTY